jgi:hypothetical protein
LFQCYLVLSQNQLSLSFEIGFFTGKLNKFCPLVICMLTKAIIFSHLTAPNIYNFITKVPGKRIDLIYHMMTPLIIYGVEDVQLEFINFLLISPYPLAAVFWPIIST